jgi:hypothetical protein
VEFDTASAERLPYGDNDDLVFTCFALEQCKDILDAALDELLRVSRRWVVLFEPSVEAFPTLAGLVHIPGNGFSTRLGAAWKDFTFAMPCRECSLHIDAVGRWLPDSFMNFLHKLMRIISSSTRNHWSAKHGLRRF